MRPPLLAALTVIGLAVALWIGACASPPPPDYFLHDQQHYLSMADSRTQPPADPRAPPFGWRLLPSALVRASGLPAARGFRVLTLLTLALIPPVAAIMLSAAGASTASAFTLAAVAALAPAVAGLLSWDFIRPDGVSTLLIIVSAWAVIRSQPAVFIAALVGLSLTKETWTVSAAFALIWAGACRPAFRKWALIGTGSRGRRGRRRSSRHPCVATILVRHESSAISTGRSTGVRSPADSCSPPRRHGTS